VGVISDDRHYSGFSRESLVFNLSVKEIQLFQMFTVLSRIRVDIKTESSANIAL